jgi:hypothetical protein
MTYSSEAQANPKSFYDLRYQDGYMHGFDYDIYEAARVVPQTKPRWGIPRP